MAKNLAIYVHYPFCKSKCPYCDFNSHVSNNVDYERFTKAYEAELEFFAKNTSHTTISSVFFGGGTPSLMPEFMVERILLKIRQLWQLNQNCEISMEANPTSFEATKFEKFCQIGVNRLSLGIQAFNDDDLEFLGRNHSANEAMNAIKQASAIFDNFSFDLIYARPQQKLSSWFDELKKALSFASPHLSLYQLTIEKGTPFFTDFRDKKFTMPDNDLAANFYEETNEFMQNHNFINYEISNYAQAGFECQHNLTYWQGGDYIGIGAGAHSRVYLKDKNLRQAIVMSHQPQKWLEKVEKYGYAIWQHQDIKHSELLEELILSSLRTNDGLSSKILQQHFTNKTLDELIDITKLKFLEEKGLVTISTDNIKINQSSKLLTDQIIAKICQSSKI